MLLLRPTSSLHTPQHLLSRLRGPTPIAPAAPAAALRSGLLLHHELLGRPCLAPSPSRAWPWACARRYLHEDIARKNHYDRLNVRHDATSGEIKKSFYSLSKTHHPDANPNDPNAGHVFSLFSESYTVLSSTARRAAYDRDVLRLHEQHHHHAHAHPNPRASYHSANNPAGGRSPSGLSRRRGTFRGPPPSFYRSGGWGEHAEKRRRAHDDSTGTGPDAASASSSSTSSGPGAAHSSHGHNPWASAYQHTHSDADADPASASSASHSHHGGMGPGDDPFGHQDEVPHFDKDGHRRTHRREDSRRFKRAHRAVGDDDIEFEPQTTLTGHFFIISGILVATILAPLVYIQVMQLGRRKKESY